MGSGPSRVSVAERLASWVDVAGGGLKRPETDFPREFLCERLMETSDVMGCHGTGKTHGVIQKSHQIMGSFGMGRRIGVSR